MKPEGFDGWDYDETTHQLFRKMGPLGIYILRLGTSWGYLIVKRGEAVPIMSEFDFGWDPCRAKAEAMGAIEAGAELGD